MADESSKICSYTGCDKPVNSPYDREHCIFHAPKDRKGISDQEFNNLIFEQINQSDFGFHGYIFPTWISFGHITFDGVANFSGARFQGKSHRLASGLTVKSCVGFDGTRFLRSANFNDTEFSCGDVLFQAAEFRGPAYFAAARFLEGKAYFSRATFHDRVLLIFNTINEGLDFSEISLGRASVFYFARPDFHANSTQGSQITFSRVRFDPFTAYFERVFSDGQVQQEDILKRPVIIFRYCQLKDVHFADNDMSLFSFYKSSFDEARFTSCSWTHVKDTALRIPYRRRNVISEEQLFSSLQNSIGSEKERQRIRERYEIKDLKDYTEIASLYRRMKTAMDRTKDYQEAGWFYFNEFEMKRLASRGKEASGASTGTSFRGCRRLLYWLYKVIAGYGEKPFWSFLWFCFFLIVFTSVHMLAGWQVPGGDYMKYSLSPNKVGLANVVSWHLWCDSLYSLGFAFSHVIPGSYLPYKMFGLYPSSFGGVWLSFLNTVVLLLFVIFIGIGLKRHFRRF